MNLFAWFLLAALAVAAVTTWLARARRRPDLEALTAPAFWVLLLALAWLLRADTVDYGRWLLLGLLLGLLGDGLTRRSAGRPGRQAALGRALEIAARVPYLIAVWLLPPAGPPAWLGVIAVVLVVAGFAWLRVRPGALVRWQPGIPLLGFAVLAGAVPLLVCGGRARSPGLGRHAAASRRRAVGRGPDRATGARGAGRGAGRSGRRERPSRARDAAVVSGQASWMS